MKRQLLSLIAGITVSCVSAQTNSDACTSIMVGRLASTDGSVMTSHTCDSWYRTWMSIEPAKDFKNDTITSVYEGLMHTEKPGDMTGVMERGTVPEAHHTYRYLNTAYPCLNEHQLAIGETTFEGRDTMQNNDGMFMIEELARIALQRCTTAREAIRLMGDLATKYGYGDSGECLTVADPKEVWIFEILGDGNTTKSSKGSKGSKVSKGSKGSKGSKLSHPSAVWAAQRIPDDCIAISANISRIGKIDLNDKDNFMASDNVFSVAKALNLWDGKTEFSFWKAYSGHNYFDEEKNYSTRELYIMQQLAPHAGFNNEMSELPVAFKPEKKVSVADIAHLLGSYYEGTDNCLSNKIDSITVAGGREHKNMKGAMIANPWMRPDEIKMHAAELGDTVMSNIRTVSVSWCAYSTVIQCRSWLPDSIGGVAWICLDNPGLSPRFPIFSGTTELPMLLSRCGQHSFRDDAALTHYRGANRIATVRWGKTRSTILPAQQYFLDKGARELPFVEQTYKSLANPDDRTKFINGYTADFFASTIMKWDELYKKYWSLLWAGF